MGPQRQKALKALEEMGIDYTLVEHEAVYTMEDLDALGLAPGGVECKNLFLRDQKGKRHFLVTVRGDKRVDLKRLQAELGCTRLSFASPERLEKHLGLTAGSVTPLGILNDGAGAVEVAFDRDLPQQGRVGVHPNDNTATVWVKLEALIRLIEAHGHKVRQVTI